MPHDWYIAGELALAHRIAHAFLFSRPVATAAAEQILIARRPLGLRAIEESADVVAC